MGGDTMAKLSALVDRMSITELIRVLTNADPKGKVARQYFRSHWVGWCENRHNWGLSQGGSVYPVEIPGYGPWDLVGLDRSALVMVGVDFRKPFSSASLAQLFGEQLVPMSRTNQFTGQPEVFGLSYHGEQVARRKGYDLWVLLPTALNSHIRGRLIGGALKYAAGRLGLSALFPFPAHPDWVTRREKAGTINVLCSENVDLFKVIMEKLNRGPIDAQQLEVLRIRAGKDLWNEFLAGWLKLRIAFYPEEKSFVDGSKEQPDLDGCFKIKAGRGIDNGMGLVRGFANIPGRPCPWMKARVLVSDDQALVGPGGVRIPDDVDGWAYTSALKGLSVTIQGDVEVFEVRLGVTKDEDHETKDGYMINLFYSLLGEWDEKTYDYILSKIKGAAPKKAAKLTSLDEYVVHALERGLAQDEAVVVGDSHLAKFTLGMTGMTPAVERSFNRIAKSFMSQRVKGSIFPAIIFTTHVMTDRGMYVLQPGEYIPTSEVRQAVVAGRAKTAEAMGVTHECDTVVRYPNTTRGSFQRVTMGDVTVVGVNGDVIFCHPALMAPMQGDSDDHVLLLPGTYSVTAWDSQVEVVPKDVARAEGELTRCSAYVHGRTCQEMTGFLVSAYVQTIADVWTYARHRLPEARVMLIRVAQAIQASVQGIKKYNSVGMTLSELYSLCDRVRQTLIVRPEGKKITRSNLAIILRGRFDEQFCRAASRFFGVALEYRDIIAERELCPAAEITLLPEERAMLTKAWQVSQIEGFHTHFSNYLLDKVAGWKPGMDPEEVCCKADVVRVIRLYAHFGHTLAAHADEMTAGKLRGLSGLAILLGLNLTD